ncbi:hypothetical protein OG735_29495 [Streptomyces sp. NBC_01210]|uniref:hypothetical protein n=1 Tax=Streptomyces sp. NBC_01210 TaxID=2903774 RepID=UPI002E155DB1|nr:hypothetical protein OG735_29495 [Streptomyces sp. NBC_01210]
MAKPHQEFGIDFGLSGLIKWFRYPPVGNEAAGLDVIASSADRYEGAFARRLLEDALRLLDSPLSGQAVTTLWLAGTFRGFDLERLGIDGRQWLRRIADICTSRIRRDDPSFAPTAPGAVPAGGLSDAVLAEIRAVGAALEATSANHSYSAVPYVVPTLERVVTEVDPELGFRLFLRAMKAFFVPISDATYDRYVALGKLLGLDEAVVDDGDFNWLDQGLGPR